MSETCSDKVFKVKEIASILLLLIVVSYFAIKVVAQFFSATDGSREDATIDQSILYFLCHEEVYVFGVESRSIVERLSSGDSQARRDGSCRAFISGRLEDIKMSGSGSSSSSDNIRETVDTIYVGVYVVKENGKFFVNYDGWNYSMLDINKVGGCNYVGKCKIR